MRNAAVSCICVILAGGLFSAPDSNAGELRYSEIRDDEAVVFFRTAAWLDDLNDEWRIPIHGWIYEPEDSVVRKKLFALVLKSQFELEPSAQTESNFARRVGLLIADSERGKRIVIAIAGKTYTLPPSAANGHFSTTLTIPATSIDSVMNSSLLEYSAITRPDDAREFSGEVLFAGHTGLSIISDIDDTVKISDVTDRRRLLQNTFFLDFAAAPGMAQLYRKWSEPGVSFHFVSSSPWQLYEPLQEFLDDAGFPRSALYLKAIRFRDETLLDLFKSGTETKPAAIEAILKAYPQRRFVLVGDSGEHDPEVYAAIMTKYPQQILQTYIRNVTGESAQNDRFRELFSGIEKARWQLFEDPRTLPPLSDLIEPEIVHQTDCDRDFDLRPGQ